MTLHGGGIVVALCLERDDNKGSAILALGTGRDISEPEESWPRGSVG